MLNEVQAGATDPRASVWVSASAGTGKTTILTQRVLRLLLGGTAPECILCLTYTKAAAAEMAGRVTAALRRWASLPEEALRLELVTLDGEEGIERKLARARVLFGRVLDAPAGLRIQTIHSFCQTLLASFPLEAGVPVHFELMEEQDGQLMLHEALMRVLTEEGPEKVRLALGRLLLLRQEKGLMSLMRSWLGAREEVERWLARAGGMDEAAAEIYRVLQVEGDGRIEVQALEDTARDREGLRRIAAVWVNSEKKAVEGDVLAAVLRGEGNWAEYVKLFLTLEGKIRAHLFTKEWQKLVPEGLEVMKAEAERVVLWQDKMQARAVAEATEALLWAGEAVRELYRDAKMRRGVLDYDDLLSYTYKLLKGPFGAWVSYRLDAKLEHLLVDEAQDTSPLQWGIVEELTAEFFGSDDAERQRTLFVVGDFKQSIYGFQGAAPAEFVRMKQKFAERVRRGDHWREVPLQTSYRSSAAVLEVVDRVFQQLELRRGMEHEEIYHALHRNGEAGLVECWPLLELPEKEERPLEPWREYTVVRDGATAMAERVAEVIRGWLDEGRVLPSKGRAVVPGDILILVRKRTRISNALSRALKARGIPVAGADRLALQQHIAVEDMLALAEWLLLPEDDFHLACVLKSPIGAMSEEALFALAYQRPGTLWETLQKRPEHRELAEMLAAWLGLADYLAPYELFHRVLQGDRMVARCVSRMGMGVEEVLEEFLSMALGYEQRHVPSLQGFVQWMRGADAVLKRDMEQGRDEVRIMTVHGAKGLQAPIVILPESCGRSENREQMFVLGDEAPVIWSPSKEFDCEVTGALRERNAEAEEEEGNRLLYVALTRAEDELYVGGWKDRTHQEKGSWYAHIKPVMAAVGQELEMAGEKAYRLTCPQEKPVRVKPVQVMEEVALPEWWYRPVPVEAEVVSVSPSLLVSSGEGGERGTGDGRAAERGIVIHRLLEYVRRGEDGWEKAERWLAVKGLEGGERELCIAHARRVVEAPELAWLFEGEGKAEVSVAGRWKGQPVMGCIDRLIIKDNRVVIVDFKTSTAPPERVEDVPQGYIAQMAMYRELVKPLYPHHIIEAGLLWTASGTWMVLPETMLESVLGLPSLDAALRQD